MGIQLNTYDTTGRQLWSVNDRTPRIFGVVETGQANGSVTVPGQGFYALHPSSPAGFGDFFPVISVSGGTIAWNFINNNHGNNINSVLIYGAY